MLTEFVFGFILLTDAKVKRPTKDTAMKTFILDTIKTAIALAVAMVVSFPILFAVVYLVCAR